MREWRWNKLAKSLLVGVGQVSGMTRVRQYGSTIVSSHSPNFDTGMLWLPAASSSARFVSPMKLCLPEEE